MRFEDVKVGEQFKFRGDIYIKLMENRAWLNKEISFRAGTDVIDYSTRMFIFKVNGQRVFTTARSVEEIEGRSPDYTDIVCIDECWE